ncbi:MAG TPA: EAL domain-containing protein, partial [Stellaceae bacterium]|nr:EAL domain-containing protein [Stellaceae bacterium]
LTLALLGLQVPTGAVFTITRGPSLSDLSLALAPQWLALATVVNTVLILLVSQVCLILDQRVTRRSVRDAERLYELTDITFEGIAVLHKGTVLEVNPSLCRLLGRSRAELVGRRVLDLVAPESKLAVGEYMKAPGPDYPQIEILVLGRDDEPISVDILSRMITFHRHDARVVAVRDNTERKQGEERVRHLGNHDPLTGLANRSLFGDRLSNALAVAARAGGTVAMLCLDLDGFKLVNDQFGHQAGDQLLLHVAVRLRQHVRALDTVARVGGDEFAIIQPLAKGVIAVEALASRLVAAIAEPFRIDDHEVAIAVSIGIALYPADGTDAETLLKNADMALYRAKRTAPGSYSFFEPALGIMLRDRRALTQDLRAAIGTDQLSVHYQPMFDCDTATVLGFEALLRWTHPERGAVAPSEFIPLAEEAGLIDRLGLWVLETACTQAMAWPRRWRIAVNLSPDQFRDVDFPATVAAVLRRTGLSPERLELEVTEGLLIADTPRALAALTALKTIGVSVSLDDFGTGFSSLSYLRRFRFDRIKIDQSFIRELGLDDEALVIVRAIVALGGSLGLAVTAEGVETQGQLDLLRELGCGEVQGFLLGRPEPCPSTRTFSKDDWSWASHAGPEVGKHPPPAGHSGAAPADMAPDLPAAAPMPG